MVSEHTVETLRDLAVDALGHVLVFEINGDDIGSARFRHGQTCRDGVDGVDLGGSLQECPFDATKLSRCLVNTDHQGSPV